MLIMKIIYKISFSVIAIGLFLFVFKQNAFAQLCPYNYCSGYGTAQDPHGIGSFRGSFGLGNGGGFDGSGWSNDERERGQPFEIAAVSNFNCNTTTWRYDPYGVPWCAFYAGACNSDAGFYVGCGSRVRMRIERSGGSTYETDITGTAAVYDTTPSLWGSVYRWDGYGPGFVRGNGADYSTGRFDAGNYLSRFGYVYAIYASSNKVRSPSGSTYTTSGCWNCDVSRSVMSVKDHRPQVEFPDLTFCSGDEMNIRVRIRDADGIDDISDVYVNFNLRSGQIATLLFENSTAQRYNNWRWNQSANFHREYSNSNFTNNMTFSSPSYPSGTTREWRQIRFSVGEKAGFDVETDIVSLDARAYDAQYSRMEDESLYGTGNFIASPIATGTPVWIDPPQGNVTWVPDNVSYPSSGTARFFVDDPTEITGCRLRVTGAGCQSYDQSWGPANCGTPASPRSVNISTRSGTGTAQCTATFTVSSAGGCGDTNYSDNLTVQYAQPWMMTLYGDTYSSQNYGGMTMWNTSYADYIGEYTAGDPGYFSSYLLSLRNSSSFPTNDSLRGYILRSYNEDHRSLFQNSELVTYFEDIVRANEDGGCSGIDIYYNAQNADFQSGCSSKSVYFRKGSALTLPNAWNQTPDKSRGCIIISDSNIIVPASFSNIDAFFLTEGTFTTSSNAGVNSDSQLIINGGVVAGNVSFGRDLPNDDSNPAEIIMHDPKYIDQFRSCIGEPSDFKIREDEYGLLE